MRTVYVIDKNCFTILLSNIGVASLGHAFDFQEFRQHLLLMHALTFVFVE